MRTSRTRILFFSLLAWAAGSMLSFAQDESAPGSPPLPQAVELEEKVEAAEAKKDSKAAASYRALLELRKKIDAADAAAATFRKRLTDVPAELERIGGELNTIQKRIVLPEELGPGAEARDMDAIDSANGKLKAGYEAARARREGLVAETTRRKTRLDEISQQVADAKSELRQLDEKLALDTHSEVDRLALRFRQSLLQKRLPALDEEKKFYRGASELLSVEKELADRESEVLGKLTVEAQRKVDAVRVAMAKEAATKAAALAEDPALPTALEKIAGESAGYAQMRTGPEGLATKIAAANRDLAAVKARIEEIDRDHADATEQVKLIEDAGLRLGESTGNLLRKEKRQLPVVEGIQAAVREGVERLTEVRLEIIRLEAKRRESVSDTESLVAKLVEVRLEIIRLEAKHREPVSDTESLVAKLVEVVDAESRDQVRGMVEAKRDNLDKLIADYRSYGEALADTLSLRRELIVRVREYSDFIEQRVFWIRSAPPLHASDFGDGLKGLGKLTSPSAWNEFGGRLLGDMGEYFILWVAVVFALGYLIVSRAKHKRLLGEAGDIAAKRNCRVYTPTLKAIFHTSMIAAPIPLVIGFLYLRSSFVAGVDDQWARMISNSLRAIFFPTAALAIARGVCRSRGLVQCHLGLAADKAKLLFGGFSWAMVIIIPLVFFREALLSLDFKPGSRICFIASMVVIAGFAFKVLRPSVGLMSTKKKSLWEGCAYPVYLTIMALAAVLAIATYLGYYYTVTELSWRVRLSVWMVLAVILVASIIMRLLIVSRRRVAFDQRLAAFRAAQAEREKVATGEEDPEAPNIAEIEADMVNITRVKEQTQSLIRMAAVIVIVIGLWRVWVEVAPSLKVLDGIDLWSTAEEQTSGGGNAASGFLDAATGGSDSAADKEVGLEKIVPKLDEKPFVSLADLGLSILTLFLTYFAARNIPGLLEITLLQRLKMKPGGSYTVTTVVRYIIVLVGIITAFAYVDITWGKVQWIAAAITLGVGFGLQEVFANFVAGLILLFERPIRLGDFVTVGGVNGTVTQIRMRATTIKDRGNKELLVPNKEFITGQLVNWTLTDLVIRVEVPVGIAYGSDTELARKLLLEVGKEHKTVLDEPCPQVVFSAFGASSLDFELRVFIRGADDLVSAASDLHFSIDQKFRKNGIEIAFPQQDLHIRTVPEGLLTERGKG